MPTIQRIGSTAIRINVPDHRPPHVHVVLADRRDALVVLDTLAVISSSLNARDINEVWHGSKPTVMPAVCFSRSTTHDP